MFPKCGRIVDTVKRGRLLALVFVASNCILAFGADVNPFDPAVGFNLFVEGNFTNSSGQVRGPAAAGGHFIFNSGTIAESSAGSYLAPGDILPSALVVDGSVQWGNSSQNLLLANPGNVKIGNPGYIVWPSGAGATIINLGSFETAIPRIQTSADQTFESVDAASGIQFLARFASIADLSGQMSRLEPATTGTELGLEAQRSLNSFGLSNGLNVINLTAGH